MLLLLLDLLELLLLLRLLLLLLLSEKAPAERMTGCQCAECGVGVSPEQHCHVTSACGADIAWLCR